ncbi:MAG: cobalamin-binding protein [Blastocatellia bacterium]|nr:cobalamin-binding protein [Blastocatellia bacterium]
MRCPELQRAIPLVLWLALCLSLSCSVPKDGTPSSASRIFTDEIGRQITVKANPQRIISLAPSITEILFALKLGDRVVGVTSYCDFPAEANAKEKVGDTIKPNLERLIALKPDLVLISTASQLEKITQQLDQLGIPVFVSNPKTVQEVIASIRKIGEITNTQERAAEIAVSMQQRVAAIRYPLNYHPPSVLYVLQLEPLITAGQKTFINDLITSAGGLSISGDEKADYPQFSREAVIARAPEVIIIPASHGAELVNIEAVKQAFGATPAIKNNRIVRINPDLVSRPGPRIVEGLEALRAGIHGQ